MPRLFTLACLFAALLPGGVVTAAEQSARIVELETPLASAQPLQAYLRQPDGSGPLPAIVLLHGCAGNWKRLDERWGGRLAAWGYVTLAVDSFGPRGIDNTCAGGAPVDMAFDAYRALVHAASSVDEFAQRKGQPVRRLSRAVQAAAAPQPARTRAPWPALGITTPSA